MMARSKCSNQRPDTLMRDRSPPARRNHLQRTAGPYIRVNLVVLTLRRSFPVFPEKRAISHPVSMSHTCQQRTFVSSCISDPAAHARPDEAAPGTPMADDLLLASSCHGSAHPRIWYSSLANLTTRIDPYSVVLGSARRSEFQSKLACPLEGLRRITRRERHGSGYVRKASASRGGKHR